MGIRYYAYAFDPELTEQALVDPYSIISDDPLADAWGLEPGAAVSVATFEQAVPARNMLYLDKAWRELQLLTGPNLPGGARPSYRMFEGQVTMDGYGWIPWVRTLRPDEMPAIARDLRAIDDADAGADADSYVVQFLRRARAFASGLAAEGRGAVYLIG